MQEPLFNVVPVQLAETVSNGVLTFYGPAITDDMTDRHADLIQQEFQVALGFHGRRYMIAREQSGARDWILTIRAEGMERQLPYSSLHNAQHEAMAAEWKLRTPEERGDAPSDIYDLSDRVANPEAYEQYM